MLDDSLEARESFEIYESFQPKFRFVESFQRFIQIHESESDTPQTPSGTLSWTRPGVYLVFSAHFFSRSNGK